MRCARCNGMVIYETDPYDGESYVCINCGNRPRITPLAEWYAKQERPTDQLWPQQGKTPATRVWE